MFRILLATILLALPATVAFGQEDASVGDTELLNLNLDKVNLEVTHGLTIHVQGIFGEKDVRGGSPSGYLSNTVSDFPFSTETSLDMGELGLDGHTQMWAIDVGISAKDSPWSVVYAFQGSRDTHDSAASISQVTREVANGVVLDSSSSVYDVNTKFETAEQMLGLRYTHEVNLLGLETFLYGGGGVTYASYDLNVTGGPDGPISDSGDGVGYWYGAGAYWMLTDNLTFGVDAKWSHVKADVGNGFEDQEIGGQSIGLSLGLMF